MVDSGIIQSQQKVKLDFTELLPCRSHLQSVVLIAMIVRDYELMVPKLNQIRYEHTPEKFTNQDHILLLSEFNFAALNGFS